MEGFLRLRVKPWKRVAITRTLAMVPTLLVALFASRSILNRLNEWLNVLQSFQLPFALIPLLHFAAMPGIMGPFKLKGATKVGGRDGDRRKRRRRSGIAQGPHPIFASQAISWGCAMGLIGINMYLLVATAQGVGDIW